MTLFINLPLTVCSSWNELYKFPLESVIQTEFDMVVTKSIELADWKIIRLFGTEQYRPQIYDNFNGELRATDERLFCWIGIENGIYGEYYNVSTIRWTLVFS
jgi:hypothetical protein